MKLATIKNGTRDGRLAIVSKGLTLAVFADDIAPTLLSAIEDWASVESPLRSRAETLNAGRASGSFAFDPAQAMAPLPRCYQWLDGSTFANHGALMERAFDLGITNEYEKYPLVYQGASDDFIGPRDDVELTTESDNMDFEGEVAVVVDEVPMGTAKEKVAAHIKLMMLVNDVSLRNLIPAELAKNFGFFQSKPASSFSPVAVTPDELGVAWSEGKVHLPLHVELNGARFGAPNAGEDMTFSFPQLIAHAAKTRALCAGSIVGSGTVSNKDYSRGSCCIAERRTLEQLDQGQPRTPFMKFGDRVKIEMFAGDGASIFGAIDQQVTSSKRQRKSADEIPASMEQDA